MNKEKEFDRDLLIRQAKLLYPEAEEWVIEMAVDAHIKGNGELPDVSIEEAMKIKNSMFDGLEYKTE